MKRRFKLTFFVQDSASMNILTCQHATFRRNVEEAWVEYRDCVLSTKFGIDRIDANNRFSLVGAVKGLVKWMDGKTPLRRATWEEIRKMELEQ